MYQESELQQIVHRLYEGSTDYPTSTEEDYLIRRGYMNDAIRAWAFERNIKWKELFINLSDAADGDKTTTSGDSVLDTPSNFIEISSFVKIGDVYYTFMRNDRVMNALRRSSGDRFFYVTGNASGGYKININPAIDSTGDTISYSYYKLPELIDETTDKPEMSKPYFVVYYTLARLHEQDLRNDLVTFYEDKAQNLLDEMVVSNEVAPHMHADSLEDLGYLVNGDGFGF